VAVAAKEGFALKNTFTSETAIVVVGVNNEPAIEI